MSRTRADEKMEPQNRTFPDDPKLGRCLLPEHPLSFETLAAYDFDPNAEVLLALEVLQRTRPEAGDPRFAMGP